MRCLRFTLKLSPDELYIRALGLSLLSLEIHVLRACTPFCNSPLRDCNNNACVSGGGDRRLIVIALVCPGPTTQVCLATTS